MAERIDRNELRALIREALKEALGADALRKERSRSPSPQGRGASRDHVRQPHPAGPLDRPPSPQGGGEPARFASGVLNETKVAELGRTHSKIIIGADVAVTPLARDRAREIKVEIVRQKP
jgi:hypothetical protein